MKILKYKKTNNNQYKVFIDDEIYNLYSDIIIKYELLLKKEITKKDLASIIKENNKLKAYYECLKALNTKLRTKKELNTILKRKNFLEEEITYALTKLEKEGYLNHKIYIEAYIHDSLSLKTIGPKKILNDLEKLGFASAEIQIELSKTEKQVFMDKIKIYIDKKLKVNKKSANEFRRKITIDLINKGFNKEDIDNYLNTIKIKDNTLEITKIVNKLYNKYIIKYDIFTTKLKIKNYLYSKGYTNINIDDYLKRTP